MKTCTTCKKNLETKDFSLKDGTADGYSSKCRNCMSEQQRKYYKVKKGKVE